MASLASAHNLLKCLTIKEGETFNVYKLPTTTIVDKIKVCEYGTPSSPPKPCKVLLLVGATGDGKTTWINRLANHLMGVSYDDDVRYKLIEEEEKSQALSQTKEVAVYKFHLPSLGYTLVVIDTPGFGDTGGLEEDCKILPQIHEALSLIGPHSMDEIHGVGLVIKANSSRLNAFQKHVFHSIFQMLGKDTKDNIFVLTTFDDCDENDKPLALSTIEEDDIRYAAVFRFNNKTYTQNKSQIDEIFWSKSSKSFEELLGHLGHHCGVSLDQTRVVMEQHIVLEETMTSLHCQMEEIVVKINEIKGHKVIHPTQVEEANSIILMTKVTKIRAPEGVKVTSCSKCQYTCHRKCSCNTHKYWCRCINVNGKCRVCPGKCLHKYHVNDGYIYERQPIDKNGETDTIDAAETPIADLRKKKEELIKQTITEACDCLKQLDEIAFKPNSLSETDYIDLLIETEKSKHQPGWENRIINYEILKKEMEAIAMNTLTTTGNRLEEPPENPSLQNLDMECC